MDARKAITRSSMREQYAAEFYKACTVYQYGAEQYKAVWHKYGIQTEAPEHAKKGEGSSDEKLAASISRAKRSITELALCNDFSHFMTLTLAPDKNDRTDLKTYVRRLGYWIGNYNKKYSTKLIYLMCPELHKDGVSWHMHGLWGGIAPQSLAVNTYGYSTIPDYERTFGFLSMSPIKNRTAVSRYITKYVSKDLAQRKDELNAHLYYASHGLQRKKLLFKGGAEVAANAFETDYCYIAWADDLGGLGVNLDTLQFVADGLS